MAQLNSLLLLVIALTIYAPVELTRAIIIVCGLAPEFIFEICFIWVFYISGLSLVAYILRRKRVKNG